MVLNYTLVDNLLTAALNDYMAQPVNVLSYGMPDIARRILAKNPGLGLSQINAVLEEFAGETCRIIEEGGGINTPLFNAQPSMPGVYHSATDSYDPKRHRIKTNLTPGTRMRKATAAIKTQKVQVADPAPFILEVYDILSESANELLTPSSVIQVRGGRLKLAAANPANGIFLIDEQGQALKLVNMVENKPARLIAMLPTDLPAGNYTLEVRSSLSASNNKETKTIKTGRFVRELTAVGN
jgi:hypothetical protein